MYIEDSELRDIYKTVTPERLQKLEAALMHLEKQPNETGKLDEFLREAHTLKGDSRMLGVKDVETLIHQMEDAMAAVKRGEKVLTQDLCDRLYHGLDAIGKLVHEAVTNAPSGVNTFLVLAELMGAASNENGNGNGHNGDSQGNQTEAIALETDLFGDNTIVAEAPSPTPAPQAHSQPEPIAAQQTATISSSSDTLDTIRIEAERLDDLMRQAGELNVTKLRIARRMVDIEEILRLYEDWSRDTSVNRANFERLEQYSQNGHLKTLQDFWKRAERRLEQLGDLATHLKYAAAEDTASLTSVTNQLESDIQTLRLLPLSTIFNLFPRMVRDLAKQQGKQVDLIIEGGDTRVDKRIVEEMKDPLLHILRNAVDHGIETAQEREKQGKSATATLRLRGYQTGDKIIIEVVDDGRGIDVENVKRSALRRGICREEEIAKMSTSQIQSLIFAPGFSTRTEVTEISGRGVGLDVVRANVEKLKGAIEVDSSPRMGCEFRIRLNTNLATTHVSIVEVDRIAYAIPTEFIKTMLLISRQEIFAMEGTQTISVDDRPVSVVWLADLLDLPVSVPSSPSSANTAVRNISCIILEFGTERLGILVDAILDQQEIVLKPQSKLLKRVRNVLGATILGSGEVCTVINPQDLFASVRGGSGKAIAHEVKEAKAKNKLLLVEDSIIIRTQMKRLLEGSGYDVTIAVDGAEGFNKLRKETFDAVVSDVEMPNLSGLELTAKIRQYREYSELPIILVTTLASDADKRKGAEAGANAYLTKGDFDQKILIETLKRLV